MPLINMKKLTFLLLLLLSITSVFAQSDQKVEMADAMRSSGKIYVVVAVIAIIFAGLAIYLFSIDRRLKKIEKEK
jgi:CcmD family protein